MVKERAVASGSTRLDRRRFPWQRSFPCNCPLLFVIPSAAEGSAVLRTFPGNAGLRVRNPIGGSTNRMIDRDENRHQPGYL
jgi:hypothetical protein